MQIFKILYKDWIAYRRYMIFPVFYLLIFSFSFHFIMNPEITCAFLIPLSVHIALFGILQYDEKFKTDIMMRVIPVKPSELAAEKYLLLSLFWLCGNIIFTVSAVINSLLPAQQLFAAPTPFAAALSFLTVSLLGFMMIPLYFKCGVAKGRLFMNLLYVAVFGLFGAVFAGLAIIKQENFQLPGSDFYILAFFLAGAVLQWLGYRIAGRICEKKEL